MDVQLAARLNEQSTNYDSALYRKLAKLAKDYVTAGIQVLDYYIPDFDAANDIVNCFAEGLKADFERDRTSIDNFRHPMGATEITTLATFVSQILFGGETTRKVEPRNPEDEEKADIVNELLAWNDGQQPTYNQGYHWVWDALTFNRGVMYDHWQDMMQVTLEPVESEAPYERQEDPDRPGKYLKKPRDWKGAKTTRFRKKRTPVGGFVKIDNLSPYDFICDPTVPIHRMQIGRFAGHRVVIPWQELKRRSELPTDHYEYVLPWVVEKLKKGNGRKKITGIGSSPSESRSRSNFERNRRAQPVSTITGTDKIDKEDGGVVECFCIQVRARPKTYDIFDDDEDELIELLISGETDLLSVNIMTNRHDQYPYSVGEGRPNAHMQFAPSWALILKGPQDYVDYLKNRRKESLARTSGNIFLGHASLVDFAAFLDPKKDGLFIPLSPEGEASGKPLNQILAQIPVQDTTARFHEEMMLWQQTAEQATGAHAATQGKTEDPSQTATQYVGDQQMATGRISTVARLLSAGALVPQTARIISDLQQFLPDEITIRITGEHDNFDPDAPQEKFMQVRRDASMFEGGRKDADGNPILDPVTNQPIPDERATMPDIQGQFDVVPHDGSLPGTDAKKVAALSRAVEVFGTNPAFAEVFDRTRPGAIDPIKMFQKLLRATGFPSDGLLVTRTDAQKNLAERMLAQGMGPGMPPTSETPGVPGAPGTQPPPIDPTMQAPSAEQLPQIPSAAPPEIRPENV